ncbi:hypothetical protein AB0395_22110 [Streptosporangium sp. NPDC051023]|uniref:hypothetical protein n=1 Tax=Streptosporangium sp. NPDC051023 TaxID=3155410 RepID=UPI0034509A06
MRPLRAVVDLARPSFTQPPLTHFQLAALGGIAAHLTTQPILALALVIAGSLVWSGWIAAHLERRRDRRHGTAASTRGQKADQQQPPWREVCRRLRARFPDAVLHTVETCSPGEHDDHCRGSAQVGFLNGHTIIVSRCRHDVPDPDAAYILAHEVAHLTGARWTGLNAAVLAAPVAGPVIGFLAGLAVAGPARPFTAAGAAGLVFVALHWATELSCDVQAQQDVGRRAAVQCWRRTLARDRALPWGERIMYVVNLAYVGTHPPTWLRLIVAHLAGDRTPAAIA